MASVTRTKRWEDARWELLGAVVYGLVLLALNAAFDPSGWMWSALVAGALIALAVSLVYAIVVLALYRRSTAARDRRNHPARE